MMRLCRSLNFLHDCTASTSASSTRCNITSPQFALMQNDCTDTYNLAP